MRKIWEEELIWTKYHFSIAQRLFNNFKNYEDKKFLSSTIIELAHSTTHLINAYLIFLNTKHKIKIPTNPEKKLQTISENIEKLKITESEFKILLLIFQIRKDQKNSSIQFLKKNKIILLAEGKYKILTHKKLQEIVQILENMTKKFKED